MCHHIQANLARFDFAGGDFTSLPLIFFYNMSLKRTVRSDFIKTMGNFSFSTPLLSDFRTILGSVHGWGPWRNHE